MNSKKWLISVSAASGFLLLIVISVIGFIDPYFHYRKPQDDLVYSLHSGQYQNNGIVKHFTYEALITGTSMSENFKTSEFDALYDMRSIKVPLSGELQPGFHRLLSQALRENPELKLIISTLDNYNLVRDHDLFQYGSYPEFLYNSVFFDDLNYLLNKDVFLADSMDVVYRTLKGFERPDFDSFASWSDDYQYGKEHVLGSYERPAPVLETRTFSTDDYAILEKNLSENIISLVKAYPEVEFNYFFPPYSVVYWDWLNQRKSLTFDIDVMRATVEILAPYPNVNVFSWSDSFDLICDLDNYKDRLHYGGDINSMILTWIHDREGILNLTNYTERFDQMQAYYAGLDYDEMLYD